MKKHADRAVCQRRHRVGLFRQNVAIEVAKISGIVEGEDLATAALDHLVAACQTFQQNSRIAGRTAGSCNVFTAPDAPSGLDQ